ncbi:hypothetical protein [Streptomyces sp. NRRL F-4428]|uniref:hypothetical protein n=1 Tax=Streptomyces sp. NRRL F-4428 TaxID=1609137 RepID=UPI00131D275E|nr:hypothetical protein [Streptomyces sp. NRRL F-4428]
MTPWVIPGVMGEASAPFPMSNMANGIRTRRIALLAVAISYFESGSSGGSESNDTDLRQVLVAHCFVGGTEKVHYVQFGRKPLENAVSG